jgi:hypothetical protein
MYHNRSDNREIIIVCRDNSRMKNLRVMVKRQAEKIGQNAVSACLRTVLRGRIGLPMYSVNLCEKD